MELDPISSQSAGLDGEQLLEGSSRSKTPHKILYAAEVKVFKAQHGGLEEIRQKLGYSRRKMCQLLMVDPSAWTRWMKDEDRVPAHIYRALEWFLALNQKAMTSPDLAAIFAARYRVQSKSPNFNSSSIQREISSLQQEVRRQKGISLCLLGGLFCLAFTLAWILLAKI